MKIAVLTSSFLPIIGGRQVFAYYISRQLAAFGHTVDVYVPRKNFLALSQQYRALLKPLPRWFYGLVWRAPPLGLFRAQRYLRRRQRTEGYDAWLVVAAFPAGYVAACLQGTVPIVLRASGDDIQKSSELDYGLRLNRALEAKIGLAVSSFDRVVAMTEAAHADLVDLGAHDDAIVGILNGVDVDWFGPERRRADIRAELGWPQDRSVILTTGRNHPKKGFDQIPSIAEKLRSQGILFRWYVVGLGANKIDADVRSRGLEDYVMTRRQIGVSNTAGAEWRFPDKKLVMMYQGADVYAFPTLLENLAMVLFEAMAAGAVVVSTDAPGCRDVFTHGETGLQARAGDVDDFVHQMSRALNDLQLRSDISKRAHEFVRSRSWTNIARQYEAMFQHLAEERRSGISTVTSSWRA